MPQVMSREEAEARAQAIVKVAMCSSAGRTWWELADHHAISVFDSEETCRGAADELRAQYANELIAGLR